MYNLIQIEHHKLLRRNLFWILMAINLLINILYTLQFWNNKGESTADLVWPHYLDGGIDVASLIAAVLMIVLVGASIGQGYTWRTTQQTLASGVSRLKFILVNYFSYWLPALGGFILFSIIFQIINLLLFSMVNHAPINFIAADWKLLAQRTLITYAITILYGSLTFLIAFVTRSTIAAISIGMFIAVMAENLLIMISTYIGTWAENATRYLPGQLRKALTHRVIGSAESYLPSEIFNNLPSIPNASIAVCIYLFLTVSMAYIVFRQQDLSG